MLAALYDFHSSMPTRLLTSMFRVRPALPIAIIVTEAKLCKGNSNAAKDLATSAIEITEQTRGSLKACVEVRGLKTADFLFRAGCMRQRRDELAPAVNLAEVAERDLEIEVMREIGAKKWRACRLAVSVPGLRWHGA